MSLDYDKLPNLDLAGGIQRYIEHGVMPGHFLTAVLSNDLTGAISRADDYNLSLLPNIVKWLYNEAPSNCWGSPGKVLAWHKTFWPENERHEEAAG